jgi:hypothetical protein
VSHFSEERDIALEPERSLRVFESHEVGNLGDEIERVKEKFGEALKAQIAETPAEGARREFGFSVIFENGRFRVVAPKVRGAAGGTPGEFDPEEAGHAVVLKMQQAESGAWTGTELQTKFGLSPANLHKRRAEFRTVWWKDAKNRFHYPKWQFDPAGAVLNGVSDVLQVFQSSDQWRIMRYFLAPRHELGNQRPLDLLRRGEIGDVVAHATAHAEENSW